MRLELAELKHRVRGVVGGRSGPGGDAGEGGRLPTPAVEGRGRAWRTWGARWGLVLVAGVASACDGAGTSTGGDGGADLSVGANSDLRAPAADALAAFDLATAKDDAGSRDGGKGDAGPPDGGPDPACSPSMTYGGGETAIKPGAVTAKLVDESGAPAAGQPVFLCGLDICSAPKVTGADGTVTISTDLVMKRPALKLGDALHYAELALPVGAAPTDFTLGGKEVLTTGKLLGKPGAVLSAGATATSGDVSLTLAPGTDIGLDGLLYVTPDDQELRAVRIPLDHDAPVFSTAAAPSDFALLYGVAPAETLFCPPARVTVTLPQKAMTPWNDLGWAPGTPVEFWIMTVDTGQFWAPYAGWAKASGGTVSADGHSVTTTDGFPVLENFAIRKAP